MLVWTGGMHMTSVPEESSHLSLWHMEQKSVCALLVAIVDEAWKA